MKKLNPFINSNSNKRYFTADYYYKKTYNTKIFKIGLDASFSCPNRDGKCGTNGCYFCSANSQVKHDSLIDQFNQQRRYYLSKYPNAKFIIYFQSFTNTYSDIKTLQETFEPFINENVVAINIATRPDSIDEDIASYLNSINKRKPLYIELGLQTVHDEIAECFNRGYNFDVFLKTLYLLNKYKIKVIVHLINGLKNESLDMMVENALILGKLDIHGIKIHSLNIVKNSLWGNEYLAAPWTLITKDDYIKTVIRQLENLPSNIVIYRLTGDALAEELIAPTWSLNKIDILNNIDKTLAISNSFQGKNLILNNNLDAVNFTHQLIIDFNDKKIEAIDATVGNGYDSKFLVNHYQKVISLDIQELAIKRSKEKLMEAINVELHLESFINIDKYINNDTSLVLYNLGFLPGSNHQIITNYQDTIKSITASCKYLKSDSMIIVVIYTKHPGGLKEYLKINEYLKCLDNLDFEIVIYHSNQTIIKIIKK